MNTKRKTEVFSAGCPCCDDTVRLVQSIAGSTDEVEILDMHAPEVAARAKQLGIERVPAVVIDGKLAECCVVSGVNEEALRAAGIGSPR